MSDLISRLSLKDRASEYALSADEYKRLCKIIDTEPTAYDVDKAIKELNKLDVKAIKRYKGGTFGDYEGTDYYIKKSEAIEIVKQGGVSDESDYVCEWRIVDRPHNLPIYNTSCGKIRLQYTTGVDIYCNGCGNKIKVKQNDN